MTDRPVTDTATTDCSTTDDMVRLLDAEGHLTPGTPAPDPEALSGYYRDMVLARRLDEEGTALQRKGELAMWVPLRGQEAAQVGAVSAARDQDRIFPSYREHAMALARGVTPAELLRLFRGTAHGGWSPDDHNFHLYTLVIADQLTHATGYAMGVTLDGDVATGDPARDEAVLVCFGDGATSQGDVHEAMVFAASFDAPVVFYCQNNQWAISEPVGVQSHVPLARRADAFGFPGTRVDGNDVLAVHRVVGEALDRARSGGGPSLVEAFTYRMGAHTTSDDPTRYRTRDEEAAWARRDPIARVRTLLEAGGTDEAFFADADASAAALAEELRTTCAALPDPEPASMFEHVYATPHIGVDRSRAAWRAYAEETR